MKHIKLIFALVISSMLIYSCNDNNNDDLQDQNPTNLDSGRSAIGFTTDSNFAGSTSFNLSNTTSTFAYSSSDSLARIVEVRATDVVNNLSREVIVILVMPATTNTNSGNVNFSLDTATTSSTYGNVSLRSYRDTISGPTYQSVSGNVTLTRLTNTDVMGTFSGRFQDTAMNVINVTNGSFSGRF
ncbi:MAG: hypothetical protein ABIP68_04020 [Ferruginibacter sp.]